MKKTFLSVLSVFCISMSSMVFAVGDNHFTAGNATDGGIKVEWDGDLIPLKSGSDIGTTTDPWDEINAAGLTVSGGIVNIHESFLDLAAASTTTYKANGFTQSTTTLVSAGTTYATVDLTQGDFPRNAVIVATFTAGSSTKTFTASAVFTGINAKGASDTETISFSTNTGTGVKGWSSISSIVITVSAITADTSDTNAIIHIGTGDVIGLANDVTASGDVYKVLEAGADLTTYTLNVTYDTIDFATNGDGSNDYEVYYKADNSSP